MTPDEFIERHRSNFDRLIPAQQAEARRTLDRLSPAIIARMDRQGQEQRPEVVPVLFNFSSET